MILYKNVCDFCSNEEEITEKDGQLDIEFSILTLYDSALKNKRHRIKHLQGTFCSKECLIEYFKENLTEEGKVRGIKDE